MLSDAVGTRRNGMVSMAWMHRFESSIVKTEPGGVTHPSNYTRMTRASLWNFLPKSERRELIRDEIFMYDTVRNPCTHMVRCACFDGDCRICV